MSVRWTPHTPDGWEEHCRQNRLLFLSAAWGDVLCAGFRSQTLYAVDEHGAKGTLLRVFPAGPFRIAYLGFPIAVAAGTLSWAQWMKQIRSGTYESRVDQVRMVCSAFSEQPKGLPPGPPTVETRIPSLPDWSLDSVKSSVRYEIRKAAKRGITIGDLTDPQDMRSAYALYAQTLQRHSGTERYTPTYFDALGHLSLKSDLVRISFAYHGDRLVAFLVAAIHGESAYYLHGGFDEEYRSYSASYPLLADAISWARQQGCEAFNMLMSPVDQAGLIRFKETWWGISRQQHTYPIHVRPARSRMFQAALRAKHLMDIAWERVHSCSRSERS